LAVYTTAARAARATEDVMTEYLPIVLGQGALQWLRHLGLGKKLVTRNPNPEYSNPNPKYPKPEFCLKISGSNLQNPNLFRVIQVSQSGT
jgi:hypothetical protein